MGMTNFAQTMHDWQRMCKYFDEHYHEDCCHICPIKSCGAIWEMANITNWEEFEEIINTWAAEHPEPKYPTWREYLTKIGLIKETKLWNYKRQETTEYMLNENADRPIPAVIAAALGLEPCHE